MCKGMINFIDDPRQVTETTQNHKHKKSNEDVEGVWIRNQIVNLIPRGIGKIFPNLEYLGIHTQVEEVISSTCQS
jgi:hypothetical protein